MSNGDPPVVDLGPPELPVSGPQEHQREKLRGYLAMILVGVFVGEIAVGFIYLFVSGDPVAEKVAALKELATIFLSPTVALVGAATGFYFGGKAPS